MLLAHHESLGQCLQERNEYGMGQTGGFTRMGKLARTSRRRGYDSSLHPTRHQSIEQTMMLGTKMSAEDSGDVLSPTCWAAVFDILLTALDINEESVRGDDARGSSIIYAF